MDHVVYVDAKEKDLQKLLDGQKRMIIRGAAGRKLPYGRVQVGDQLYFMQNNAETQVRARAQVVDVFNLGPLNPEESAQTVSQHQSELQLAPSQEKRWSGKRYLVLIRVGPVESLRPFAIDRHEYGNMDDWLPVGGIERVKTG